MNQVDNTKKSSIMCSLSHWYYELKSSTAFQHNLRNEFGQDRTILTLTALTYMVISKQYKSNKLKINRN